MLRSPTLYTRRHVLTCGVALGVTTLAGCNQVTVSAPAPGMTWIIGLDITDSVPKPHFLVMRERMIPTIILARVRRGDEVYAMPIETDLEQRLVRQALTRNVGLNKEIMPLYDAIKAFKRPDECPKLAKGTPRTASPVPAGCPQDPHRPTMWTNIGGVLAYAKRRSLTLQAAHERVTTRRMPARPMLRIMVTVFTDGKPEGAQTPPPTEPWPTATEVWFWGVEPQHISSLQTWATTTMGIPPAQLHIVRFADWSSVADTTFGPQIDRPYADPELLKHLGVTQVAQR